MAFFIRLKQMLRTFLASCLRHIVLIVGGVLLIFAVSLMVFRTVHAPRATDNQVATSDSNKIPEEIIATSTLDASSESEKATYKRTVEIKGKTFRVDVVESFADTARGLSGRTSLGDDEAMLFVFAEDSRWGVWMKDMKFAIDVIWLDTSGKVVTVISDIKPETYPNIFVPEMPARYFIEVKAGTAKSLGVVAGNQIAL